MARTKVITFAVFLVLVFAVWFHVGDTASSSIANSNKEHANVGNINDLDLSVIDRAGLTQSEQAMLHPSRKLHENCCAFCPCYCDDSNCPACWGRR
ncbi:hypothetical protein RND71_040835 [Anisodus tanguticus]|uniref:Uncharacterized protein n=1 Tax=Anisodus tanguticus TaxID=243964 RepID=A0AAE1QTK2_9SOLA|nr:hypothetical protein RND71_040835 [Anisodus tanguticus]